MNKTALVTGGSHNIGQGIAIKLAENGYDVAITYNKRRDGAEETAAKIETLGQKCFIYQASLDQAEVPQQVVDAAYHDLGHLDLLVCNAGDGGYRGSLLALTPEKVDYIYSVNFRNYVLCAAAASRYMVRDGIEGNIIFITSTRAEAAYPEDMLYGGLKAGIERAVKSMALDMSTYHIRVNCVAPGAIWPPEACERYSEFVEESIPLHRSGTPEDIGNAVVFIASEKASYITGISLQVDGGLILPHMMEGAVPTIWKRKEWQDREKDAGMKLMES